MRTLKVVDVPSTKLAINDAPGFFKKDLAHRHIELMGLCGFGCAYCSSNDGNYLRIRRADFAAMTRDQLGEDLLPAAAPSLTFRWPDVLAKLEAQLRGKRKEWGAGETLIMSQLTDAFSGAALREGVTRKALGLLLERTSFRLRILTKNSTVGLASSWLRLFAEHRDRVVVGLSIGTLDAAWARRVEVGVPPPAARLRAHRALLDAGVPTFGMLCPVFPDALPRLDELVDAIEPARCETVWAEPFNDRQNWRRIRDGYEKGSAAAAWLTSVYERGNRAEWSGYATSLLLQLRQRAAAEGWLHKLKFLLYEGGITHADAEMIGRLDGVLLQDAPDRSTKRSAHPVFARLQAERAATKE